MEILARSGGVQLTDRIELAEYRDERDDLSKPLEFRVAGGRYQPGADQLAIAPGDRVTLRRDHSNEHDKAASLVLVRNEHKLGFVPRQYSRMVASLLDANVPLEAVLVRKLILPAETGRWVVRLWRAPS
ncbi:MAG: HIRAN domain-containing protein [Myxococcales bacterium]|nr:HIRAN domain-containing protein [Myxococcales bacterium]